MRPYDKQFLKYIQILPLYTIKAFQITITGKNSKKKTDFCFKLIFISKKKRKISNYYKRLLYNNIRFMCLAAKKVSDFFCC